jgi:hypothetical protein
MVLAVVGAVVRAWENTFARFDGSSRSTTGGLAPHGEQRTAIFDYIENLRH